MAQFCAVFRAHAHIEKTLVHSGESGAGGRTRTDMSFRTADFESAASTIPPRPHGANPLCSYAPRVAGGRLYNTST
jgi:hypothetical protein